MQLQIELVLRKFNFWWLQCNSSLEILMNAVWLQTLGVQISPSPRCFPLLFDSDCSLNHQTASQTALRLIPQRGTLHYSSTSPPVSPMLACLLSLSLPAIIAKINQSYNNSWVLRVYVHASVCVCIGEWGSDFYRAWGAAEFWAALTPFYCRMCGERTGNEK